jgi:hypothetical protein
MSSTNTDIPKENKRFKMIRCVEGQISQHSVVDSHTGREILPKTAWIGAKIVCDLKNKAHENLIFNSSAL